MKRPILCTLLLYLSALHLSAQVPERIHWQAFLTDDSGTPIEGPVDLAIRLYASKTGGTATYAKDTTGVFASGGVVDVPLGPLSDVSFAGPLYVGVSVNGGAELVPRSPLGSVPYAFALRDLSIERMTIGVAEGVNVAVGPNAIHSGVVGGTISGGGGVRAGTTVYNRVQGDWATVGGGRSNTALWQLSTIGGGTGNYTNGEGSTIGGGAENYAGGQWSTIGGGGNNRANESRFEYFATVAGGEYNNAGGNYASIGGGYANLAPGGRASIGGGQQNSAAGEYASIGGGLANLASGNYATIAGGGPSGSPITERNNRVYDNHGAIGGGGGNRAGSEDADATNAPFATVSGGKDNQAVGEESVVSGGSDNLASGRRSAVGGGVSNEATAASTTVAGGFDNTASSPYATVGGGNANRATGNASTIPGGFSNEATAPHSFAAGFDAHAVHEKTFVWNDGQRHSPLTSENPYEFWVGAGGGAIFEAVVRPGSDNVFSLGLPGKRWTVVYATEGTINTSDARLKSNIEPIPYGLDAVMALDPVRYTWADRPEAGPRLGLLAQDTREIVPEVVRAPATDLEFYGLSYAELVPVLIRAIQEQQGEIEALRAEVAALEVGTR